MSDCDEKGLTGLVERLRSEAEDGDPTLGALLEASGSQSMGPVLFIPALIAFSPVGAIPGVSIAMGTIIILFAGQMMFGRHHLWLPKFISNRKLPGEKVQSGSDKMQSTAKRLDRWLGNRWTWATRDTGATIVGVIAVFLGVSMFPLALIPFAVFVPSGALLILSAGLMTNDGLLVVIGGIMAAVAAGLMIYWSIGVS